MNIQNSFFSETSLAVFQDMVVFEEIGIEGNKVYFSLVKPKNEDDYIALVIEAKPTTDYIVYNKSNDPQNDMEVDFDSLAVDTHTPAMVEEVVDCYAIVGMPIGLTESQQDAINTFLKEHFEAEREQELSNYWAA